MYNIMHANHHLLSVLLLSFILTVPDLNPKKIPTEHEVKIKLEAFKMGTSNNMLFINNVNILSYPI